MNSDLGRNEPPAKSSVTPSHIRAADALIATHIRRTPIVETASPIAGAPTVSLKLECLQHSGSFKARGAFHNLLTRPAPPAGCATASGGNHGAAVAYAARKLGVTARIFVPEIATPGKIARIRAYGAEAVVSGASYAEAQERCDAYVAESGALPIHPYDALETIAGAGTVALEWEEDLRRLALRALDTVLVAVGGGGLIAGVAAWFAGRVKVVGVEPEGSRALHAALEAGAPGRCPGRLDRRRFARRQAGRPPQLRHRCRRSSPQSSSFRTHAIVEAQRRLWREISIVAEPGGAAAFAALVERRLSAEEGRAGRRPRLRRERRSNELRSSFLARGARGGDLAAHVPCTGAKGPTRRSHSSASCPGLQAGWRGREIAAQSHCGA